MPGMTNGPSAGRPAGHSAWVTVLGRPPGKGAGALHATRIGEAIPRARARNGAALAQAQIGGRGCRFARRACVVPVNLAAGTGGRTAEQGGRDEVRAADLRRAGRQREPGPGSRRGNRGLAGLHGGHQGGGGAARRGAAHLAGHGHHGPAERRGTAAHRRAVRRDQGALARLLPAGGRQPRRGAGLGGQDAHHALRHRGGAAGAGRHALADSAGVAATAALERAFRYEWTTVVAVVSRRLGDLQAAEDAAAEAFTAAATAWRRDGVPPNPGAWLTLTAWRKAVDQLRRDRSVVRHGLDEGTLAGPGLAGDPEQEGAVMEDERLGLIFACCHPALALEVRVALTLRYAAGLTTREIAAAFLLPEPTIAQRLVRAKRKIRDAG